MIFGGGEKNLYFERAKNADANLLRRYITYIIQQQRFVDVNLLLFEDEEKRHDNYHSCALWISHNHDETFNKRADGLENYTIPPVQTKGEYYSFSPSLPRIKLAAIFISFLF